MSKSALIMLSGSMESTVCLGLAMHQGYTNIKTVTFDYPAQLNKIRFAVDVSKILNIDNIFIDLNTLEQLFYNAFPNPKTSLQSIMISIAYSLARQFDSDVIYNGSTYDNNNTNLIKSLEHSNNIGHRKDIKTCTPVKNYTNCELWEMAESIDLLDMVINMTFDCLNQHVNEKNEWGFGCGQCAQCVNRKQGFDKFMRRV